MESFHIVVLSIAIITLILILTLIGYAMNKSLTAGYYPKKPSSCPDYWDTIKSVNPNTGNLTTYCKIPSTIKTTDISNVMLYKSGNKYYTIPKSDYSIDTSGNRFLNFSNSSWNKTNGCKKYKWANSNNWSMLNKTPISWDGITNIDRAPC